MVKKVVDSRVHTLIKNCVQTKHRSFFVVVGDKGKDQVKYFFEVLENPKLKESFRLLIYTGFYLKLKSHLVLQYYGAIKRNSVLLGTKENCPVSRIDLLTLFSM